MVQFIKDLFKNKGKWSFKRVTAFYLINFVLVYVLIPLWNPKFDVLEFVVITLITYSATMLGLALHEKLKEKE